jgi:hypothetical protein
MNQEEKLIKFFESKGYKGYSKYEWELDFIKVIKFANKEFRIRYFYSIENDKIDGMSIDITQHDGISKYLEKSFEHVKDRKYWRHFPTIEKSILENEEYVSNRIQELKKEEISKL